MGKIVEAAGLSEPVDTPKWTVVAVRRDWAFFVLPVK